MEHHNFSHACFITGTDTGIGKTVITAAFVAVCRAANLTVAARKPILSGLDEEYTSEWPPDHQLLATISGETATTVTPSCYGPPVSPHLARELIGEDQLTVPELLNNIYQQSEDADALIIEGVGGLLVPFSYSISVRDLIKALNIPVVIVARSGLGTINHTLLTIEATRSAGLDLRGVVLNQWPKEPTTVEESNRRTIERISKVEVTTFPQITVPTHDTLLEAGSCLPWQRWLKIQQ